MSMSIRTNVASLDAQRNLYQTNLSLDSTLAQLSSGFRITKASDDAAGLGISTNLEAQIASFNQAARNANDGISMVQTASGALNQVSSILTRMRSLAMEAASDGIGGTQRGYISTELTQLSSELDRISATTTYNGSAIFGAANALQFQVGTGTSANDSILVDTTAMDVSSTGLAVDAVATTITSSSTASDAQGTLTAIDAAIDSISGYQAQLGAAQNRFNYTVANIQSTVENFSAANSRIRDVDVAQATSDMARQQILAQAGVAVLAQANSTPQLALKLLG